MKFGVTCFGSITYDTYVTSDEFKFKKENQNLMLCEEYGRKILIKDYVTAVGGGASNAAVCFERLGLETAVISCIGGGHLSSLIKAQLVEEGVSLIYLQTTEEYPTSSSIVLVGSDGGRTVLVHRAASSHLSWYKVDWSRLNSSWAYISSLGGDFNFLERIILWAGEKNIKIAFNPGGQEIKQAALLKKMLKYIDILILNKEELLSFLGKEDSTELNSEEICKLGSNVILVTDGKNGSTLYTQEGKVIFQKAEMVKNSIDETGAGDAFGSSFVAGQMKNLSYEKSLKLATLNSASVVQYFGPKAGLLFWPDASSKL